MLKHAVHVRRASFATTAPSSSKLTVGIRRENPSRIWERRCPLTPDAVESLVHEENVDVLIQDCDRRVFPAQQFLKVCDIPVAGGELDLGGSFRTKVFRYRLAPGFIPISTPRISYSASKNHHLMN